MSEHFRRRSRSPRGRAPYERRPRDPPDPRARREPERRSDFHPSSSIPPAEPQLPALPTAVEIPRAGSALPQIDPIRPHSDGGGSQNITVGTNHFRVLSLPHPAKTRVWQHTLRFTVPSTSQRRASKDVTNHQRLRAMRQARADGLGSNVAFDGVSNLFSTSEITPRTITVDMKGHTAQRPNQISIAISSGSALDFGSLVAYLRAGHVGLRPKDKKAEDCLLALVTIFQDYPLNEMKMSTRPNSGAFFKRLRSLTTPLPSTAGVLEALRGIFQLLTVSFGGQLTLNVDMCCSAFFAPGLRLDEVTRTFAGIPPNEQITNRNSKRFLDAARKLVGVGFAPKHQPDRTIRVKSISTATADSKTFEVTDPNGQQRTVSVKTWFEERYGIALMHPDLPLIDTLHQGFFPMEICLIPEAERYKELLQGSETADFIKACTKPPADRRGIIFEHLKRLQWHRQSLLTEVGIAVETSMLELSAKVLFPPRIEYGQRTGDREPPRGGAWNLIRKKFYHPQAFRSWGVLYFPTAQRSARDEELQALFRQFITKAREVGMNPPNELPAFRRGNVNQPVEDMIRELRAKAEHVFKESPVLFFLVHEGQDSKILYKIIKNVCDIEGTPSQCMIVEKALSHGGQPQYVANVCMKVNVKLGGTNTIVENNVLRSTMILGADVSHPSPEEIRTLASPPSIAALVGTMNQSCSIYSAVTAAQPSRQEGIANVSLMFDELVKRFQKRNSDLFARLIYFRDGIGDSQVQTFLDTEVKALKELRDTKRLPFKIAVVLCVKRHHTRFFRKDQVHLDKGNVPPGTFVENSRDGKDFFAVTQKVIQGTGRPCHYSMVYDELNLSAAELQRLVMTGCFTYAKATRSVGLHPAVYYADQVAMRARTHFREEDRGGQQTTVLKDVHDDLRFTMWWQ